MKLVHLSFEREGKEPVERLIAVLATDTEFQKLKNELEDSFASYMESSFDESAPTPYTKAVKDVMDACGYRWMPLDEGNFHSIRI